MLQTPPVQSDEGDAFWSYARTVSQRGRLAVVAAQVCVIAGLGWLWSTGSSDATATSVDWAFVGLSAATPLALAMSAWVGWKAGKRSSAAQRWSIRGSALGAQWLTLGLLAVALLVAPLAIFGAVFFGPMG